MRNLILILFFLHINLYCFSQPEKQKFIVSYSDSSYVVRDSLSSLYSNLKSWDIVYFNDWSFLDSLRYKLEEFYVHNLGYDTINERIGGMILVVNTFGKIVYYSLVIPENSGDLYSLSDLKKLTDLLKNFHFNLSDYKRPAVRHYRGSNRETYVDTFEYFTIIYSTNKKGKILSSWDGLYERQLTKMLLGTWSDEKGKKIVFEKPSTQVYAQISNPLTGIVGNFRCVFRVGRLYIYFDKENPSVMSYKFQGDRLTLEGIVGNQKVHWNLKRVTSTP